MGLEENKGSCSSSDLQRPRDKDDHGIQGEYGCSLGDNGLKRFCRIILGSYDAKDFGYSPRGSRERMGGFK